MGSQPFVHTISNEGLLRKMNGALMPIYGRTFPPLMQTDGWRSVLNSSARSLFSLPRVSQSFRLRREAGSRRAW